MSARIDRRRFVLALGAGWILAPGCESSGAPDAPARDVPGADAEVAWSPGTIELVIGERTSVDLAATLPSGVVRGGVFSVAPDGTALPAGMSLEASGTLLLGTATVGITDGVVFVYDEA